MNPKVMKDYHREPAEWQCPTCGGEIWIVHCKSRLKFKGMYCDCSHWGGFVNHLPKNVEEWIAKRKPNTNTK